MAKYSMDMSKESERLTMKLDEGWYPFEVISMKEEKSKSGNMMFEITIVLSNDPTTGCTVFAVAEEGKRWFLKQLLSACGVSPKENGVYDFDTDEIVGKTVNGYVTNQTETWINRNGEEQTTMKSKVVKFQKLNYGEAI
jgi:hypothetical protein